MREALQVEYSGKHLWWAVGVFLKRNCGAIDQLILTVKASQKVA